MAQTIGVVFGLSVLFTSETKETTWKESPLRFVFSMSSKRLSASDTAVSPIEDTSAIWSCTMLFNGTQRSLRFWKSEFPSRELVLEISGIFQNHLEVLLADLLVTLVYELLLLACSVCNSHDIPKWDKHWRAFSRAELKFSSDSVIFLKFFSRTHKQKNISIYSLLAGINLLAWDRTNHRLRSWVHGVSPKNNDYRQAYFSPLPLPRFFSFQLNSHSLGRIFVSPQASSEFESKMALALSYALARDLAKIRLHCRLGVIEQKSLLKKVSRNRKFANLIGPAIRLYQKFWNKMNCWIFYDFWMRVPKSPLNVTFVFRLFNVFHWKVTEYFWIGIKKTWSNWTKIALEKKFLEIRNSQTHFYFFYAKLTTVQIWEQLNKFHLTCSSLKCLRLVDKLYWENNTEKICLLHKQTPPRNTVNWVLR